MLIGLSVNHKEETSCISDAYVQAVIKAGGVPILIPITTNTEVLDVVLTYIDCLILSGGGDIHASFFNETMHPSVDSCDMERDRYDLYLTIKAIEKQMPILGICRGHQIINVALGGNLIQDISLQIFNAKVNHKQSEEQRSLATHTINIYTNSVLYKILKKKHLLVNSFHHQAIKTMAPILTVAATSEDGLIEAVESADGKTILGVQWHPESMAVSGNDTMSAIFRYIIDEATLYWTAKAIHAEIYTIDSHCDTPIYFHYGIDIGKINASFRLNLKDLMNDDPGNESVEYSLKVDIPKMQVGMLDAVFMVAYLKQGSRDVQTLRQTVEKAKSIVLEIIRQAEVNQAVAGIALSTNDLKCLKAKGKKAIFIGIENGYGIGKDIDNIRKFAAMGVRYITLSHNGDNDICDSAVDSCSEHNGLSAFGRDVVREMNQYGILVDISHASEKTALDAVELSDYPIIASHSSVKSLCNHPRNVSDRLIKAIAGKGGVIQICIYPYFLKEDGKATVQDIVNHIDYVVKLAGFDHVGIGSDFDGGGGIIGIHAANELPQITLELLRRNYTKEQIAKIWGGNLMRVLDIAEYRSCLSLNETFRYSKLKCI